MFTLHFEWDEKKNQKNRKKHSVWFEEAQQVFGDSAAIRYDDLEHSEKEERFILVGRSDFGRLLVIVFCERGHNSIRIISARKPTSKELKIYEKGV